MICIAIPSRGRPQFLRQLVTSALSTASELKNVAVRYYLNDDDPELSTYVDTLKKLKQEFGEGVQWTIGPDQNTVLSWEQICESFDADYYMLAGDEVTFETQGWDKKFDETKQKYPVGGCAPRAGARFPFNENSIPSAISSPALRILLFLRHRAFG